MPLNKFIFTGRIVKEPEFEFANDSGKYICKLVIAQNTSRKKADGTYDSIFFSCTLWPEETVQMLRGGESVVGRQVACAATVMPRRWIDKETGKWKYATTLNIYELEFTKNT